MTVICSLFFPISVAFLVIILGYFLGRIKLFNISLDLSGVLILAVFTGWIFVAIPTCKSFIDIEEYKSYMKFFSTFGTALFVSAIGISTGNILDFRKWQDIKAMLIGSLMVSSAFATIKLIPLFDKSISISKLLGTLCGALTTTPGLSAVCELKNIISEEATLGYGCTYIFGVVATVLFAQISARKLNSFGLNKESKQGICKKEVALNGLIQIGCTVILGGIIGNIEILKFSLGNTGGILCSGIVIGLFVKKHFPNKSLLSKELTPFRSLGLCLFFVGNGIMSGMQVYGKFDIKIILYGILMSIIPIVIGTIFYKIFFNDRSVATIIAGGMTSTPAIGILTETHNNISLSRYTLSYFGALITVVILIRI